MVSAWTIGMKYKKKSDSDGPGPGQYTSRNKYNVKNQPPQWTIGTSQRDSFRNKVLSPGPGMYKTSRDNTDGPKYHFGTKSVSDLNKYKKSIPGPGQYNPESNAFSNVAFTFNGRNDITNKSNLDKPGPGAYSSKSSMNKTLGKFGTSNKGAPLVSKLVLENPGPGQYAPGTSDIYKTQAPKYGFGSELRGNDPINKIKALLPGPGQYGYAPKVTRNAPGYSLTPRRPDTTPGVGRTSPGPGNYNPSDDFSKKKMPRCKFGSSTRTAFKRDGGPSPDAYNLNTLDSRKKSSPSFGFGNSKRQPLSQTTNSPGPGNYNMPSKIVEKNGFYMGSRYKDKRTDDQPGPGNYNPDDNARKTKSPTYKIGSSPRGNSNKYKDSVPGPGNYKYYNPNLDKGQSVKIGTERRGWQVKSDTPGPGDYYIPVKIVDVPRYLIPNPDERYKFV